MASETDIANLALTKLGAARVMSMDDDVKAARAVKAVYAARRDAELRLYAWNFAIARASLAAETTPPAFGYEQSYPLPSDFLRLVDIVGFWAGPSPDYRRDVERPWAMENGRILADLGAPLQIRYVYRCADTSRFDPTFVDALACKIAAEIAPDMTDSLDKRRQALAEYKDAIATARRLNAIEGPIQIPADDSWVLGRRG